MPVIGSRKPGSARNSSARRYVDAARAESPFSLSISARSRYSMPISARRFSVGGSSDSKLHDFFGETQLPLRGVAPFALIVANSLQVALESVNFRQQQGRLNRQPHAIGTGISNDLQEIQHPSQPYITQSGDPNRWSSMLDRVDDGLTPRQTPRRTERGIPDWLDHRVLVAVDRYRTTDIHPIEKSGSPERQGRRHVQPMGASAFQG